MKPQLENSIEEMFSIIERQGEIKEGQDITLLAEIKVYANMYNSQKAQDYFRRFEELR